MEGAHDHRIAGLRGPQLPGWITLSLVAHLLVISLAGGPRPSISLPAPLSFTVDIASVTPELDARPLLTEAPPEIKPQAEAVTAAHIPPPVVSDKPAPQERSTSELPSLFDSYLQDVDVAAQPANDVFLRYPWIEYRQRLGGVVRIALMINEHGGLDSATVLDATPTGRFEEAAMEAVRKLQFTPAVRAGRYVKSRKTIEVVFDPNEHLSPSAQK